MIDLADGRIMLVYSRFIGGRVDHPKANLAARCSADGGATWTQDDVQITVGDEGGMNTMSPSLLRMRDGAYHNGAIWPWLIGAFLEAYVKVNDRSDESIKQAHEWLTPLVDTMKSRGCIGQIAEIFEATEPYRPVGCPAQAWSVAEALRLAVTLGL